MLDHPAHPSRRPALPRLVIAALAAAYLPASLADTAASALSLGSSTVTATQSGGGLPTSSVISSVDLLGGDILEQQPVLYSWELFRRAPGVMLTEFGGISFHPAAGDNWMGYATVGSEEEYLHILRALFGAIYESTELAGFCYTQLTDTQQEKNGLYDENRRPKLPVAALRVASGKQAGATVGLERPLTGIGERARDYAAILQRGVPLHERGADRAGTEQGQLAMGRQRQVQHRAHASTCLRRCTSRC